MDIHWMEVGRTSDECQINIIWKLDRHCLDVKLTLDGNETKVEWTTNESRVEVEQKLDVS
jgi:hypothetical protein